MKKINYILMIIAILSACEPLKDDKHLGDVLDPSDLDLEVYNTTAGGNQIVLINNTDKVGSYWDYVAGISVQRKDTVVLPFVGKQTIKFVGFCDGGQVTTTRDVQIDKIDHDIDPIWIIFAGSDINGKSWVWDIEDRDGAVYGTGGWLTEFEPSWDLMPVDELEDKDCSLVFDLNGSPNLSKVDASGNVIEKGSFSFDMTSTKNNPDDGSQWSIGELKISGVTVLSGHAFYDDSNKITKFQILTLTEEKMVLCWNPDDAEGWTDATFWCFKAK